MIFPFVESKRLSVIQRNKEFSESYDEYLEFIYQISTKNSTEWVKNKDIAEQLGIKPSSVSKMLEKLREHGLIEWKMRVGVRLTPEGKKRAEQIIANHRLIALFLKHVLGLSDKEEIDKVACNLEHYFNSELNRRLLDLMGLSFDENERNLLQMLDGQAMDTLEIKPIFRQLDVQLMLDNIIEFVDTHPKEEVLDMLKSIRKDPSLYIEEIKKSKLKTQ